MKAILGKLVEAHGLWNDSRELGIFQRNGLKPWTRGYRQYRREIINKALNSPFDPEHLQEGYGYRTDERAVEYPWVISQLPETPSRILDAGSTLNQDFVLDHPTFAQHKLWITTLAPEKINFLHRGVSYTFEDIRELSFQSDFFDVVTCISTIEHVGLDNVKIYTEEVKRTEKQNGGYVDAIRELRRVLKPGGTLLVSIPFGQYRNHGWFQIFDLPMVEALIDAFEPSNQARWFFRYLPDGWHNSNPEGLCDATYFDINETSEYGSDFAAASRGLAALRLVK